MRVLIADDHPLYLEAARDQVAKALAPVEIVTASTLPQALGALDQGPFAVILLDYSMPGMDGIDGVRAAVAASDGIPVVIMSGVANPSEVRACIEAGAKGFLPKTLDPRVFASAMTIIVAGGSYIPAEFVGTDTPAPEPAAAGRLKPADFTPREFEILGMVTGGLSNKEIARKLDLQEVTIKLHLTRIFSKMGVKNRAQAAVSALQNGLVTPGN